MLSILKAAVFKGILPKLPRFSVLSFVLIF